MVAARRGSPLLVGVKSAKNIKLDFVDVSEEEVVRGKNFMSNLTQKILQMLCFHPTLLPGFVNPSLAPL